MDMEEKLINLERLIKDVITDVIEIYILHFKFIILIDLTFLFWGVLGFWGVLELIRQLYEIEREVKELDCQSRQKIRQEQSRPIANVLFEWMRLQRMKITDGSATARALDYTLKRWDALTRYIDDGQLPIDNNWIENQIRPIAIGRSNWLGNPPAG